MPRRPVRTRTSVDPSAEYSSASEFFADLKGNGGGGGKGIDDSASAAAKKRTRPGAADASPSLNRRRKKQAQGRAPRQPGSPEDKENENSAANAAAAADAPAVAGAVPGTPPRSPSASKRPPVMAESPRVTPYHEVLKERGGTVSPRETRSAVKKRRESMLAMQHTDRAERGNNDNGDEVGQAVNTGRAGREDDGAAVMLMFSPPNQRKNRERERKERERSRRRHTQKVDNARKAGQLLEFDKFGNPLTVLPSTPAQPPAKKRAIIAEAKDEEDAKQSHGETEAKAEDAKAREEGERSKEKAKDDDRSDGNSFCLTLSPDCSTTGAGGGGDGANNGRRKSSKPDPESLFSPAVGVAKTRGRRSLLPPPSASCATSVVALAEAMPAASRHDRRTSITDQELLMSQMSEFREALSSTTSEIRELQQLSRPPTPQLPPQQQRDDGRLEKLAEQSAAHAANAARLEERNATLVARAEQLESQLSRAKEKEDELERKATGLKGELKDRERELSELKTIVKAGGEATEAERATLEERIAESEKELHNRTLELNSLKDQCNEMRNEGEETRKETEEARSRIADLERELKGALEDEEKLQKEVEQVKSAHAEEIEKLQKEMQSRLEETQSELDKQNKANETLQANIGDMELSLRSKEKDVAKLKAELENAREEALKSASAASKEEGARAAAEAAAEVRAELKAQAAAKAEEIEILKDEVQSSNDKLARLEEDSKRCREEYERSENKLRMRLGEAEEAVRLAEEEKRESDQAFGELEGKLHCLQEEMDAIRAELAQTAAAKVSAESANTTLRAQLDQATAAKDAAEASNAKFESEIERENELKGDAEARMCREVEDANARVQRLLDKLAQAEKERDEVREANADLEDRKAQAERERDEVRVTNADLESAFAKLRDESAAVAQEKDQLQAKTQELTQDRDYERAEKNLALRKMETFDARELHLLDNIAVLDEKRRYLHNRVMKLSGNIRVYVRVRPVIPGELGSSSSSSSSSSSRGKGRGRRLAQHDSDATPFSFPGAAERTGSADSPSSTGSSSSSSSADDPSKNVLIATEPFKDRGGLSNRRKRWNFGFDNVFSPEHGQTDVWEATEPLVQSCVDGYNVCIFAYGQTGSGKTHTMLGDASDPGIVTRAVSMLFANKAELETGGKTSVGVSVELLEIYNEKVRDLLAPNCGESGRELNLRINSNEAVGNVLVTAETEEDVGRVLHLAQRRRCVKATQSNSESSRSHLIFTLHFETRDRSTGFTRSGKLHVCDLAGSERLSKSGAHGTLLKETQSINKSLAVLSNVIESLQSGERHVPYRESKLTYLLKNSLGGDSKTLAVVCCNPLPAHFNESMCSLRFANKVGRVELKATGNFSC